VLCWPKEFNSSNLHFQYSGAAEDMNYIYQLEALTEDLNSEPSWLPRKAGCKASMFMVQVLTEWMFFWDQLFNSVVWLWGTWHIRFGNNPFLLKLLTQILLYCRHTATRLLCSCLSFLSEHLS
jgi:hypothetical protein